MKNVLFPLLWCFRLLLSSCQPHYVDFDGSGTAATNTLNRVEAQRIEREKRGEKPPGGYSTWRAYWRYRFALLQQSADEGSGSPGHILRENLKFIKRARAEAGLPPVE